MNPNTGDLEEAFNTRLVNFTFFVSNNFLTFLLSILQSELRVLDIKFLHMSPKPTFAALYQDPRANVHVMTHQISLQVRT